MHDIGMQCDIGKEEYVEIRKMAEELGAEISVQFDSDRSSGLSDKEQETIRINHNFISAAWIKHSYTKRFKQLLPENDLDISCMNVPENLIADLVDICLYHSKLDINKCPQSPFMNHDRKKFIISILRFADELDIDHDRIALESYDNFRIPSENLIFWWLHERTTIDFDVQTGNITMCVHLHPKDKIKFSKIIENIYINNFKEKNKTVIDILRNNNIPIAIGSGSKVTSSEFAPPIKSLTKDNAEKIIQLLEFEIERELFEAEVANSINYGSLIPEERLGIHLKTPELFHRLNEEEWVIVLLSAMRCSMTLDEEIVKIINEEGERALIQILGNLDYSYPERRRTIRLMMLIDKPIFIEPIIWASKDFDINVRCEAVEMLGKIQDKRAIDPLIFALEDPVDFIRGYAAENLGLFHDPQVVDPLISSLIKDKDYVRLKTINSLIKLGKLSVEPLISLLKDPNESVRKDAIFALGQIGERSAVRPLISILYDATIDIRKAAIKALGAIGDQNALGPIQSLLLDTQNEIRYEAIEALGFFGDGDSAKILIDALEDKSIDIRKQSTKSLGRICDKTSVEPLIDILLKDEGSVASEAAKSLGNIGDLRAVEPLIIKLTCTDWSVRASAAEALGRMRDNRAVKPLIKALNDDDICVRIAAVNSLGYLGDISAIDSIINVTNDMNWDGHRAATKRKWKFSYEEQGLEMIRWMFDDLNNLHLAAIKAIASFEMSSALKPLLYALENQDDIISNAAADMLPKFKCKDAVDALLNLLEEKNIAVSAVNALGEIGDRRAVDALMNSLYHEFSDQRRASAEALGKIGDARALEALIDTFQRDSDIGVITACAEALADLGGPRAKISLMSALNSELGAVRISARKALDRLNSNGS